MTGSAGGSAASGSIVDRLSVSVLAVAVAVPLVVAGARMAALGWTPTLDDGINLTRAYDVFSSRTPLVGPFSLAGAEQSAPTHSLGPMLYWLLAVPSRVGPPATVAVFVGLFNAAVAAVIVVVARRRAGVGFAAATALGLVLVVRSAGVLTFADPWNPWITLLPMFLLILLTWSVSDGDRHLFPAVVLVASFVMQNHLTYLLPAGVLVVLALIGGWAPRGLRWRPEVVASPEARSSGSPSVPNSAPPSPISTSRRSSWRWVLVAAGVGALCWTPPVIQQLTSPDGNLALVADSTSTTSNRAGLDALRGSLGDSLGVPPRWSRPRASAVVDIGRGLHPGPLVGQLSAALIIVGLVVVLVHARRRTDRTLFAGAATALAGVASVAGVAASLPLDRALVAGYVFHWFRFVGLFAWLVLVLAAARWTRVGTRGSSALSATSERGPTRLAVLTKMTVVCSAVLVVVVGVLLPRADPVADTYRPARLLGDAAVDATEPGGRYLVRSDGSFDGAYLPALVWRLRRDGRDPVVATRWVSSFGDGYGARGRRCRAIVTVTRSSLPLPMGAHVAGTVAAPGRALPDRRAQLLMSPDQTPTGAC